jgi:hypothetical protein
MKDELSAAQAVLKNLLEHVHQVYPEIDVQETNRIAYERVERYLKPEKS